MVFHGDYEVEFEIYESRESEACDKFLGYMAAVDAYDATTRWSQNHEVSHEKHNKIYALLPKTEWK